MKKSSLLTIASLLMTGVLVTSCAEPISQVNGLDDVYAAIDTIQNTDYKQELTSMVYYTNVTYYEKYNNENPDTVSANFRVIEDEVLTRFDYSNPNDLYYYNMTIRKFKYLTSYDNVVGTPGYTDTIVRFGTQFYKDGDKYVLQSNGSRGIEPLKSLKLDSYPYVDATKLSGIESNLKSGIFKFSAEQGKILFDEYFTKIVEHNYRINDSFVNMFANDDTNAYDYYATDKTFSIQCNKDLEFTYEAPLFKEVNNDVVSIEVKTKGENSTILTVSFSESTAKDIVVQNDKLPEDISTVKAELNEDTNTYFILGIDTEVAPTLEKLQGSNKNVAVNTKAGLDKNQNITETFEGQNRFWLESTTETDTANREVKLNFDKYGFLSSSYISDERTYKVFNFDADIFYTSYYTTADFNVEVPHVATKK